MDMTFIDIAVYSSLLLPVPVFVCYSLLFHRVLPALMDYWGTSDRLEKGLSYCGYCQHKFIPLWLPPVKSCVYYKTKIPSGLTEVERSVIPEFVACDQLNLDRRCCLYERIT